MIQFFFEIKSLSVDKNRILHEFQQLHILVVANRLFIKLFLFLSHIFEILSQ